MKISYAITVCNEIVEIQRLVSFLLEHKREEDEITILFDVRGGTDEVEEYLRANSVNCEFNWIKNSFKGHFADWKNYLTTLCSGDYIFQIDADEIPNESLIQLNSLLTDLALRYSSTSSVPPLTSNKIVISSSSLLCSKRKDTNLCISIISLQTVIA